MICNVAARLRQVPISGAGFSSSLSLRAEGQPAAPLPFHFNLRLLVRTAWMPPLCHHGTALPEAEPPPAQARSLCQCFIVEARVVKVWVGGLKPNLRPLFRSRLHDIHLCGEAPQSAEKWRRLLFEPEPQSRRPEGEAFTALIFSSECATLRLKILLMAPVPNWPGAGCPASPFPAVPLQGGPWREGRIRLRCG